MKISEQYIVINKKSVSASVDVLLMKDNKHYIVFSPSLELSSYGKNKKDAFKSFKTTFEIFIQYGIEKNTLKKDLQQLGWQSKTKRFSPSAFIRQDALDNLIGSTVLEKNAMELELTA